MRDPGLGSEGPLGRPTSAYLAKGGTRGSPRLWSPTPFSIPTTPASTGPSQVLREPRLCLFTPT